MSQEKTPPSDATVQLPASKQEATDAAPAPIEVPIVSPGRYEIIGEHARGGLGRILKAKDRYLSRPVALKELLLDNPQSQERFLQEALLTARLEHPGIVPVHEAGRWPDGAPFYAMKMVSGKSLAEVLSRTKTLDERLSLLPNLLAVCEAIAYAHEQKIIHRDLKPHNVLVGSFGETIVIDWGLAKELVDSRPLTVDRKEKEPPALPTVDSPGLTQDGAVVGTPAYMPPEQAKGEPVDARADVYSLGAILYELLAGVPPYVGGGSSDILSRVLTRPPRSLFEIAKGAPREMIDIAHKAMSRAPSARYPSAKELSVELRRFQQGQLVASHHYTIGERIGRWVRRHKISLSVASIALLLIMILGIISLQQLFSAWSLAEDRMRLAEQRSEELQLAQQKEIDRSDTLLLANARASLQKDPTQSIAWLKKLSSRFTRWGEARIIAAAAASGGVAKLLIQHPGKYQVSADGERLVLVEEEGALKLWELTPRHEHTFANPDGALELFFLSPDGGRLATVNKEGALRLFTLPLGESVLLSPGRKENLDARLRAMFSPDGRYLALWDQLDPCALSLWDVEKNAQMTLPQREAAPRRDPLLLQTQSKDLVAFSKDSQSLACLGGTEAWRFSASSQQGERLVIPEPTQAQVPLSVSFSPKDASLFLQVSRPEGNVSRYLWSPQGALFTLEDGDIKTEHIFSPDGRYLLLYGTAPSETITLISGILDSSHTRLLLFDTQAQSTRELSFKEGEIQGFLLLPDGQTVAVANEERLYLWSFLTDERRELIGHNADIQLLAVSPDGTQLATTSKDNEVRLWDLKTSQPRVLPEQREACAELAFSLDGSWLFCVSAGLSTSLWDLTTRRFFSFPDAAAVEQAQPLKERLSSGGRFLAKEGGFIRLWEISSLRETMLESKHGPLAALRFHDNQKLSAFTSERVLLSWSLPNQEPTIQTWQKEEPTSQKNTRSEATVSVSTSEEKASPERAEQLPQLNVLAFTKEGGAVAAFLRNEQSDIDAKDFLASLPKTLRLERWDVSQNQTTTITGYQGIPLRFLLSSDGASLVFVTLDLLTMLTPGSTPQSSLYLWTEGRLEQLPLQRGEIIVSAAFSAKDIIVSTTEPKSRTHKTYAIELATQKTRALPFRSCGRLAVSPDGALIACGTRSGVIEVVSREGEKVCSLNTQYNAPTALAFSPEKRALFAGFSNGSLWLWDIPSGEGRRLWGFDTPVIQIDISPDGKTFAASSFSEVHLQRELLPYEPEALRAWLEQATNASVDLGGALPPHP